MIRRFGISAAVFITTGAVLAQAPPPGIAAGGPQPLWTVSTDFASPESAYFDSASGALFVSNINGQVLEKDGNGYISKVSPKGEMIKEKWATGLDAPKGIRITKGKLWVSDIDRVLGIQVGNGKDRPDVGIARIEVNSSLRIDS